MIYCLRLEEGVLKYFIYSCELSVAILRCCWFFYDSKRSIGFFSVFHRKYYLCTAF